MIDLHVHSTESDGSLTPEQLIEHAAVQGVTVLALCDHDTTAGIGRFVAGGMRHGITAIGGVEVSAEWLSGNCHILGLGAPTDYEPLETLLGKTRRSRDQRNEIIIEKLQSLGVPIALEEAEALAGGDVVGRPHMARVMLAKGVVGSVQEAFDRYLAKGAPAYVDRFRLDPPDAVRLLQEAGAAVVLAHPQQLKLPDDRLREFVAVLRNAGLAGIEAFTPYSTDTQIASYMRLASEFGLLVTGGSDFHGESKPHHAMGYYREGRTIPEQCAHIVREARRA